LRVANFFLRNPKSYEKAVQISITLSFVVIHFLVLQP
jgi:hypothetical protein